MIMNTALMLCFIAEDFRIMTKMSEIYLLG